MYTHIFAFTFMKKHFLPKTFFLHKHFFSTFCQRFFSTCSFLYHPVTQDIYLHNTLVIRDANATSATVSDVRLSDFGACAAVDAPELRRSGGWGCHKGKNGKMGGDNGTSFPHVRWKII